MKLCKFVSDERIPCPAYATEDSDFCPVHRDIDRIHRVAKPRTKKPGEPVICVHCYEEILPGTLQKLTKAGPIHAEYACTVKAS
jgi:hypothetical protein